MFDFDAGKLIIVGVVALIFIPTKDLPRVLRQVGQFVGKMRRLAAEFQGQFMDAMREADMADVRREAQKLSDAARLSTGLDTMHGLDRQMTSSLNATTHEPNAGLSADHAEPSPPALQPSAEVHPALDPTHGA